MDYAAWAKQNKKQLALDLIARYGAEPLEKPLAAFAAGVPGAGKTEFLDRLFSGDDFVRIDLDEIVSLFPDYKPENYYQYRGAASIVLEEVLRQCRHKRLNFVLDGTFSHVQAVNNVKNALKSHVAVIFYVWQEPANAWQLTKDREVVTKRSIERTGFIDACVHVPENLKQVRQDYGDNVTIIAIKKTDNDPRNFAVIRQQGEIDALLAKTYTREQLERQII